MFSPVQANNESIPILCSHGFFLVILGMETEMLSFKALSYFSVSKIFIVIFVCAKNYLWRRLGVRYGQGTVSGRCNMVPGRGYEGVVWCQEGARKLSDGVRKVSDVVRWFKVILVDGLGQGLSENG